MPSLPKPTMSVRLSPVRSASMREWLATVHPWLIPKFDNTNLGASAVRPLLSEVHTPSLLKPTMSEKPSPLTSASNRRC